MKTAAVTLNVIAKKKTAFLEFYIQRTSNELFSLGNSSLLVNLDKKIFTEGKLTFAIKKYTSKGYEPLQFVQYSFNAIGLQFRCNTLGKPVSDKKEKIATVVYDYTGNPSNVTWRLIDCGLVTPAMETVDTKFLLNFK